jgi:hypothetical protein
MVGNMRNKFKIGLLGVLILILLFAPLNSEASLWKVLTGRWGDGAGEIDQVRIDGATNSLQSITFPHYEIHHGDSYHLTYENLCTNGGEKTIIAFKTPDTTQWLHAIFFAAATSISRMAILEAPSIDLDEGGWIDPHNRDRNSASSSVIQSLDTTPFASASVYNEASAAAANITPITTLQTVVFGQAGGNPARAGAGGIARGAQEWILKRNTQYAFAIESLDATDNYHTIEVNYYEHINKN